MNGPIRRPIGFHSKRAVTGVLWRIPAIDSQIHPADKCDLVVDADDLLMMGRINGMALVEFDTDAGMLAPIIAEKERQRGPRRMDRRLAPDEYANVQVRPVVHERSQ
jgi:hypothetical protein